MSFWMGFASAVKDAQQRKHERELFMEKTMARQDEILLEAGADAAADAAEREADAAEDSAKSAAERKEDLTEQYMTAVNALGGEEEAHDVAASLMYSGQLGAFNARIKNNEDDLDPSFIGGVISQAREIHGGNFDILSDRVMQAFDTIPDINSDDGRREFLVQMTGDQEYVSKPLTVTFNQPATPTSTTEYGMIDRRAVEYLTAGPFKDIISSTYDPDTETLTIVPSRTSNQQQLDAFEEARLRYAQAAQANYDTTRDFTKAYQAGLSSVRAPEVSGLTEPDVSTGRVGTEVPVQNEGDAIEAFQANPQGVPAPRVPNTFSRPTQPPAPVNRREEDDEDFGFGARLTDNFNN